MVKIFSTLSEKWSERCNLDRGIGSTHLSTGALRQMSQDGKVKFFVPLFHHYHPIAIDCDGHSIYCGFES